MRRDVSTDRPFVKSPSPTTLLAVPTSEAKQLLAAIQAVLLWRDPAEGVEDRLLRAVLSQWNALTGRRLGLQARLADFLPTALIIQLDRQLIIDSF